MYKILLWFQRGTTAKSSQHKSLYRPFGKILLSAPNSGGTKVHGQASNKY